ncbi:MAG: hypothetical protein GTO02_05045 [Candidatus Dadabacteria bacterium]|nr:hypothetical protein [Candidatus Dadabacteria bacterium]NIQ13777.1 hypothetical protein [Candidatus Dadabacteria bacterium]
MKIKHIFLSFAVLCFLFAACEKEQELPPEEPEVVDTGERIAPHGGTLVVLGDEAGYLEIVLDDSIGKLTVYVLDGMAKNSVELSQGSIDLDVTKRVLMGKGVEVITYNLSLQPDGGSKSAFSVTDNRLKGLTSFQGNIKSISINGNTFSNVGFNYPQ